MPDLTVTHRPAQGVTWMSGDLERLVYHYRTDHQKPYIHPLRSSSGTELTALEPSDHPWHRALWFAWKYINGINFWEEAGHPGIDLSRHAAGANGLGRTEFVAVDEVVWQAERTRVTTHYAYRTPQGAALLREERMVHVAVPPDGSCVIDWDATFTAGEQAVRLDRTVICPDTPWGGYAGLSFRAAQGWHDVQGVDSEGRRNGAIEHQRARWVQVTGLAEDGRRVGLVMMDHPENPRYPSHWRYIDDPGFTYINPSLVLAAPYDLAPGATLRLRYRILTLDGNIDTAATARRYAEYERGLA